jgi:hypothetical protein
MQSIIENDFYAGFVHYKGERRRGALRQRWGDVAVRAR